MTFQIWLTVITAFLSEPFCLPTCPYVTMPFCCRKLFHVRLRTQFVPGPVHNALPEILKCFLDFETFSTQCILFILCFFLCLHILETGSPFKN
jgi:hypothetical protein